MGWPDDDRLMTRRGAGSRLGRSCRRAPGLTILSNKALTCATSQAEAAM